MRFGEILKKIRLKNGDSLRGLGDKIDSNFSYIDKVEKGTAPISKNLFEKILKAYPLDKNKLIEAYCKEVLPDEVKETLNLKIKDDFLSDMITLVKNVDKENQKIIIYSIIDRLEHISLKNGKYKLVEKILNEAKEKTEKL